MHVRTADRARTHHRGFGFVVHKTTGVRGMPLPAAFTWRAADIGELHGTAHGDWTYGLGAGSVGSYA